METYKNSYTVKEDEALWELHEIRHELHEELKNKPLDEINRAARDTFERWKSDKKHLEKDPDLCDGHPA